MKNTLMKTLLLTALTVTLLLSTSCKKENDDKKRIFVTQENFNADFNECSGPETGIAAADCVCQEKADAAGLGGTWKAWISDENTDAIDRIADVGPWYLMDYSQIVFNDKSGLAGEPLTMPRITELGNTSIGIVWTGTDIGGVKQNCLTGSDGFCGNWTQRIKQLEAETGILNTPAVWTTRGCEGCDGAARLYCIEQ